jgi:hypothetical protein
MSDTSPPTLVRGIDLLDEHLVYCFALRGAFSESPGGWPHGAFSKA